MEGCPCLEAEEWARGPLEISSIPPFLILSPIGPAENSGLRKLSLSALSPVLPREGEDSFQHPSQQGAHWRLLSLGRLCPSLSTVWPGPSHSYSCSPSILAGNGLSRAGPGLPPQQSKALPLLQPGGGRRHRGGSTEVDLGLGWSLKPPKAIFQPEN